MIVEFLMLLIGLVILVSGGEILIRGASSLAHDLGVSPLAIGLTVVAFGTSAPELAVNVGAALQDTGALSFGNVFGSNMANIGLIIGLVAIIDPLPIQSILIRRELPMMLLATAAAGIMAFDAALGGIQDAYQRGDGLILLLFFVVFIYYTVSDLMRKRDPAQKEVVEGSAIFELDLDMSKDEPPSVMRDIGLSVLGLAGLVGGAHMTVDGAVNVARFFEVPEVVIGLTLVSIGTSLPELVAAITAVRHGKVDMAVGAVVGSNIFNTLLVAGVTATIRPMPIPPGGHYDLAATAALSLVFTLTASTHRRKIIRYEGFMLLSIYLAYMTYRTLAITMPPLAQ